MDFITATSCLYTNCMWKCRYERKGRVDERKGGESMRRNERKDERRVKSWRGGREEWIRGGMRGEESVREGRQEERSHKTIFRMIGYWYRLKFAENIKLSKYR